MREFFESSPSRNASSSEPTITADFEVMRQRLLDGLDAFTRFNAILQLQLDPDNSNLVISNSLLF